MCSQITENIRLPKVKTLFCIVTACIRITYVCTKVCINLAQISVLALAKCSCWLVWPKWQTFILFVVCHSEKCSFSERPPSIHPSWLSVCSVWSLDPMISCLLSLRATKQLCCALISLKIQEIVEWLLARSGH